jgi:uncharacterized MAPEG superfamily protein
VHIFGLHLEIASLIASVVLGLVHVVAASHSASLQRGYRWSAGARDENPAPLSGVAGRLARALDNFIETFPLFIAVVLVAQVRGVHNAITQLGAVLYFCGRLAYLPLYARGVFLLRSLAWNVATAGIVLVGAGAVWP